MTRLDETTTISLWGIACTIPFMIGGILWLASIDQKASAAITEAKSLRELVVDTHDRIIRMEEKLNKRSR